MGRKELKEYTIQVVCAYTMHKLSTDTSLGFKFSCDYTCEMSECIPTLVYSRTRILLIIDLNGISALHPQSPHCTVHIELLLSVQFINAVVQHTEGAATSDPGPVLQWTTM